MMNNLNKIRNHADLTATGTGLYTNRGWYCEQLQERRDPPFVMQIVQFCSNYYAQEISDKIEEDKILDVLFQYVYTQSKLALINVQSGLHDLYYFDTQK